MLVARGVHRGEADVVPVGVEFDAPAEEGEDGFEELLGFQAEYLRKRESANS